MIHLAVLIHNLQMTGIPSQPIVENCTDNSDGALLLVIECKYPGVQLDDSSLKINVTVDDVNTFFKFANKVHVNGTSDEVTVQIINRYRESKPTIKQCEPVLSPVPSSTVLTSPPIPSPIPKDKPGLLKHQTKHLSAEVVLNLLLSFSNSYMYIITNSHHHHHSEHYWWNNSHCSMCSYSYNSGCSCLSEEKRTVY